MTDWKSERVRALVAAAEDAAQRTRWVFLVLTLGCAIMITAQLNLYGSWVRHVRVRIDKQERVTPEVSSEDDPSKPAGPVAHGADPYVIEDEKPPTKKELQQVRDILDKGLWDDLYNVQMPLLGIKYSADDLIILGTATMLVLALWFVYAHRRENHCINDLKDIAEKREESGLPSFIHSAVAHHFVFTTTTENNATSKNRVTKWLLKWSIISNVKDWLLQWPLINKARKGLLRLPVIILVHLPWISSLFTVAVMAYSLFATNVEMVVVPRKDISLFLQIKPFEKGEALVRLFIGLVFTILTALYCFKAQSYEKETRELLRKMAKAARADQKQMDEDSHCIRVE